MKPRIYDRAEDLLNDLNRMPLPPGRAKGPDGVMTDASQVMVKIKALVPEMFRYRDLLVKAQGGLGNFKSLRRYSEIAAENVSEECHVAYEESLNALAEEVENLMNFGASEETAENFRSAKEAINQLTYMKSSVMGFKAKLQSRMGAVETAAQSMANALAIVVKKNRDQAIADSLKQAHTKLEADVAEIRDLMTMMDTYCGYQVTLYSIFLGAMNSHAA